MSWFIHESDINPEEDDVFGKHPKRKLWETGIDEDSSYSERLEAGFDILHQYE